MGPHGVTYPPLCVVKPQESPLLVFCVSGAVARPGEGGCLPGQWASAPAGAACGLGLREKPQLL